MTGNVVLAAAWSGLVSGFNGGRVIMAFSLQRALASVLMLGMLALTSVAAVQAAPAQVEEDKTLGISAQAFVKRFNGFMAQLNKTQRLDLSRAEVKKDGTRLLLAQLGDNANIVVTVARSGALRGVIVMGNGANEASMIDGAFIGYSALSAILPGVELQDVLNDMAAISSNDGMEKAYGDIVLKVQPMGKLGIMYTANRETNQQPVAKSGQQTLGMSLAAYARRFNETIKLYDKPYVIDPAALSKGTINDTISVQLGKHVSLIAAVSKKTGEIMDVTFLGDWDGSRASAQDIYEVAAVGLASTVSGIEPEQVYAELRKMRNGDTFTAGNVEVELSENDSMLTFTGYPM